LEIHPFHAPLFSNLIGCSTVNNIKRIASLLFNSNFVQSTTRDAIPGYNEGATHTNIGSRMQHLIWFIEIITVSNGALFELF